MGEPARVDITLWRDDTVPAVVWGFDAAQDAPFDLDGSAFVLKVAWHASASTAAPAGGYERTSAQDALAVTIPAGVFAAAPIVTGQPLVPGATRDHVFTLTGVMFGADKSVTVTGAVRRSRVLPATLLNLLNLQGYDTFEPPGVVTVHLTAQEATS